MKQNKTSVLPPVRLTPDEKERILKIARERGMTFSGMVRYDYLGDKSQRVATTEDTILLSILDELRKQTIALENPDIPFENKVTATFAIDAMGKSLIERLYDSKKKSTQRR